MNWDYVAGFFDGEGCARAHRVGGGTRSMLWKPSIYISNTNKQVIEEIHNFIKVGKMYEYKSKKPAYKIQYRIYIWGYDDIVLFCNSIIDKTVVKKEILELIRDFAVYVEVNKNKHRTWTGKHVGWTIDEILFIEKHFVIPIRILIRTSSNKGRRLYDENLANL